ncbi:UvrD-helicase domain-containing protein [Alicyclobacillus ferrooxydans]|uniref:UvrD-helicase domain-containing protein n=1 Tax=Alicyclobacillus ferrooxydans TaxID=471514 RepID=UPI0006D57602|nr:ATP-dependent helicase [Alicyclobacillus ferrooxydans]
MWTSMQQEIIDRDSGNTVVVASPGSGKTTVLTQHIVHQLNRQTITAKHAMLITYTRQAAKEMRDRLSPSLCAIPRNFQALRIGTFHSEAFHMLLEQHIKVPPILGTQEQYQLFRQILREEGLAQPHHVTQLGQALTLAKSTWPIGTLEKRYRSAAARYEVMKRRLNRWDYDDILIVFCEHLMRGVPQSEAVQYLLVDEFQDTNQIQWTIIQAFRALWNTRLFVVGDDDQSIYSFRGGNPKWLHAASMSADDTETFMLTRNFRSDRLIVRTAANLIGLNRQRIGKVFEVNSEREGSAVCTLWKSESAEASGVSSLLGSLTRKEPEWSVGVLARTRQQLLAAWAAYGQESARGRIEWQTFHGAKGKEWDAVIVIGALADNPYLRDSILDLEEERRLFYVAMTRARHALWVSCSSQTKYGRSSMTPFVAESALQVEAPDNWCLAP